MIDGVPCIDAHQHYWDPARGDYFWMTSGSSLDRVFAPEDLLPSLKRSGIVGSVLVQAAPSLEETDYLLAIADREPTVLGVVGWIDFEDRTHIAALERFKRNPKFKGVRPMIQDIADPLWVKHPNITWAFDALVDLGLTFDALLHPQHILPLLRRLSRHPDLKVVVDHAAKPRIRDGAYEGWAADLARLAAETGACAKLSGLATEAHEGTPLMELGPYVDHLLAVFGPDRVMFGSDWPVCLRATTYDDWFDAAAELTSALSVEGCAAVFGGSAIRFYGLDASPPLALGPPTGL